MAVKTYLVSACLLGLSTRYDGKHNFSRAVLEFCRGQRCIPVCPEQLGGLSTPRLPAEITGGDGGAVLAGRASVKTVEGDDVTAQFVQGAAQVLLLARIFAVDGALLKARSPSCGAGRIYDGTFQRRCRPGDGVTAALLKKHGVPVFTEENLPPAFP